jgi:hypothetical protein
MANIKENKRFHFTYKTTNLINGRYYLGMHSTNRINDGYLGSGKRLYYELNKYGRDNFKFEILEQFDSREELVQAEINLITEQDLKNPNCLNLKSGGEGGFSRETQRIGSIAGNLEKTRLLKEDSTFRARLSKAISESMKKQYREGRKNPNKGHWVGRKHLEESKRKIGVANSVKQKGEGNSQFGKCWITNEIESKKIHKGDLIPEGWRLGRKLK